MTTRATDSAAHLQPTYSKNTVYISASAFLTVWASFSAKKFDTDEMSVSFEYLALT